MAALTVFPWHSGCIYRNCVVRRAPPSFPTRRSSDLRACAGTARKARARARALSDAALGLRRSLPPQSLLSGGRRSEEHTSELQSRGHLVCRLLLEKKKMHIG